MPGRGRAPDRRTRRRHFTVRQHAAGRYRRPSSGRGRATDRRRPRFTVRRPVGRAVTVPTTAVRAGARRTPIAGGVDSPSLGQWAARFLRLSSGRGPGAPRSPEASTRRLSASGPDGSYDCRPGRGLGAPRSPEASTRRLPASGPDRRYSHTVLSTRGRDESRQWRSSRRTGPSGPHHPGRRTVTRL